MMEEELLPESPVTGEMIALLTVLSVFTVVGSVGNGLVLFVFSRVRDKTTAQLFILALALIDLFTCMVIIPFTMFVEYTRYDIKYDFLCKLYQFLITSKVPLSAFIMVAIAFDRYFCICHPLRKIITPRRTKVIIVSLTLFASILGVMTSLAYGVYQVFNPNDPEMFNGMMNNSLTSGTDSIKDWTKLGEDPITKNDVTMKVELRLKDYISKRNFTAVGLKGDIRELVYIGICAPNEILLDWGFVSVYQKCYTALFLICLVIVGILYGMIYRFIGMRRNKKLQQRLVLCAYVNGDNGCGEAGTRTTLLNGNGHDNHHDDDKYGCTAQGFGAGGVYIGGCSSPPPFTQSVGSHVASSISFFGDQESGKPVTTSKDGKLQVETSSRAKQAGADDLGREEATQDSVPTIAARGSCESQNGCEDLVKRDDGKVNVEKDRIRKLTSPNASKSGRKKNMLTGNHRPQSMIEDPSCNEDGRTFNPFKNRRASSPFKREMRDGHVTKIEMRGLKNRRDSEPMKSVSREVSPASSSRFSHDEDMLTVGSRNSYTDTYLEPFVDEDCALFETQKTRMGISHVNTEASFVSDMEIDPTEDTSVPLINKESSEGMEHPVNKLPPKRVNDNENDDSRLPLLQDSGKESDHGRNNLNHKECNICVGKQSQVLTDPNTSCAETDSVFLPPSSKDDPETKALVPSTLNNQCPVSSSHQQVLLTSYVRNLTPVCSTSSSNLSPLRSYSDVSRRSTMEGGVVRSPSIELPSRITQDSSRRSTMESGVRRPTTGRKKRWQHFRCKNASIKGCHSRSNHHHHHHHKASPSYSTTNNGNGRRSIMSYDADRLRDETRAANARTALMLFTVTVVFVVAFLPAWLMAHRIVPTQLMVFYLYFTYNVANPFIYAFMNVIFKDHLRRIFRCQLCQ